MAIMLRSVELQRHHLHSISDRINELAGSRLSPKEHLQLKQTRAQEGVSSQEGQGTLYRDKDASVKSIWPQQEVGVPGTPGSKSPVY